MLDVVAFTVLADGPTPIVPEVNGCTLVDLVTEPFRTERDHSRFGPFRFDRARYDHAARSAASALPSPAARTTRAPGETARLG